MCMFFNSLTRTRVRKTHIINTKHMCSALMAVVHFKEVAGVKVVVSRPSPADTYSRSRMFNLPWHLLLLPEITLLFSRSKHVLAALPFCRECCCSPAYFGQGRCNLNEKGRRGRNRCPVPVIPVACACRWLCPGRAARRAMSIPRQPSHQLI